jgi:hypothetical protein
MTIRDPHAHCASVCVSVPARVAYDFMADGMQQSNWALGSWNRRQYRDDIFAGDSLFDGKELFVRLVGDPELQLVDYYVGNDPDHLRRLVEARIVPGDELGMDAGSSVVTLVTWRDESMSDEQWELTYHVWRTEIHLIKGLLERQGAPETG